LAPCVPVLPNKKVPQAVPLLVKTKSELSAFLEELQLICHPLQRVD
jgi:hypothetical protein